MAKVSVIYRAPKGDNKVCEWGTFTFFDGMPVEIEDNADNAHMLKKMKGNQYFELSEMGTAKSKPAPAPEPEPEEDDEEEVEPSDDDPPPFEDYQPPRKKGRRK